MERRTLIEIIGGSHLYGTSTAMSDIDLYGVMLPTRREILLGRMPTHLTTTTRPEHQPRNTSKDEDSKFYTLIRYLDLLIRGDMVSLEVFFAPLSSVRKMETWWGAIQEEKDWLITKEAGAGLQYVQRRLTRYGMPGSGWRAKVELHDVLDIVVNSRDPEFWELYEPERFWDLLRPGVKDIVGVEIEFDEGMQKTLLKTPWSDYSYSMGPLRILEHVEQVAKMHADPVRQPRVGDDLVEWKIIAHAMRVADQVRELHETGRLVFPRPVAGALREVRLGQVPYAKVEAKFVDLYAAAKDAVANSVLPDKPDTARIDLLIEQVHADVVRVGD